LFAKPAAQTLFAWQQPEQFVAPHFSTHVRFWQILFVVVQSEHALPFAGPHALSCVPITHVLPEQQPRHVPGPHTGSSHTPP
jgi:hypothetical protein